MEKWEYEICIDNAISDYLIRLDLNVVKTDTYGIKLENDYIRISITDRLGDFSISVFNGKQYKTLDEMIFEKYPDYIDMVKVNPEIRIFKKQEDDFVSYQEYFQYLIKTSFDFIQANYPEVFQGKF